MPRAPWCRPEIYEFFDRWRRTCLGRHGGLFSGGVVWSDENLQVLQTTLGAELLGSDTFFEKLRTQLESHPPVVRQLGVEIVYVEYLGERDTSAATKQTNLGAVLDVLPEGVTMPDDLREILDGGIASYGPGKQYRDAYVRFLLKLARGAKRVVRESGPEALDDPWRFRDLVSAVRTTTDGLEANAVLHACFPDEFDVMISRGHREKLLRRFATARLVAEAPDEDRKLLAVREVLASHMPEAIDEPYDDAVRAMWDAPDSAEWNDLVALVAGELAAAPNGESAPDRELPGPDPDLLERLQGILGVAHGWDQVLREAAVRVAARGLTVRSWGPLVAALRAAADAVPVRADASASTTVITPAASGPAAAFGLRPATAELASELFMKQSWLQRLMDQLAARRQVVLYGPPGTGKTWLARRVAAHAFDPDDVRLIQFHPSYTYEDFVEGYRPTDRGRRPDVLARPGATARAQRARASARPDHPHLLIIDEINRGNLPKIFGELYFLLEYRDQPLRLQYSSHEEFRLPANLYIVGTMNTADRSIALLDAALRRRFAFIELSPQAEPIRGLLERWLERHGLDPEPAVLLETLNAMLIEADGDRDLAIGPSYFMDRHGTAPDVETVWEYDILPLLAERFHATAQEVPSRVRPRGRAQGGDAARRCGWTPRRRRRDAAVRGSRVGRSSRTRSARRRPPISRRRGSCASRSGRRPGVYVLRGLTSVGVAAGPDWELRVASHLDVHEVMFLLTYARDPTGWRRSHAHFATRADAARGGRLGLRRHGRAGAAGRPASRLPPLRGDDGRPAGTGARRRAARARRAAACRCASCATSTTSTSPRTRCCSAPRGCSSRLPLVAPRGARTAATHRRAARRGHARQRRAVRFAHRRSRA